MKDDRWSAIWQVYESACALPIERREAFVRSELADTEAAAKCSEMLADLDGSEAAPPGPELPLDAYAWIAGTLRRPSICVSRS